MKKIPLFSALLAFIVSAIAIADTTTDISERTRLNFIGSVSIEPSKDKPVLGISSVRYDESERKYTLLPDDTGTIPNAYRQFGKARFYELSADEVTQKLQLPGSDNQSTSVDPEQVTEKLIGVDTQPWGKLNGLWQVFHPWTWINDGHVDTEGLAMINQQEMLISSEQGATYPYDSRRRSGYLDFYNNLAWPEPTVYSTLLRVDRENGTMSRRYYFPSYYHSSIVLPATDYLTSPLPEVVSGVIKGVLGVIFDPIQGLRRNKGIESIDRIPGTDRYVAITEAPLEQDRGPWKEAWPEFADHPPSRIIEFTLGDGWNVKVKRELLYVPAAMPRELSTDPNIKVGGIRQGISDMLALDEHRLLVLERTYIRYKEKSGVPNKSVIQLFLVNTNVEKSDEVTRYASVTPEEFRTKMPVSKDLLFSCLNLRENREVFETLNIEGITFGQDINGEKAIVLVNENDAATTSPTQLLFFTLSN